MKLLSNGCQTRSKWNAGYTVSMLVVAVASVLVASIDLAGNDKQFWFSFAAAHTHTPKHTYPIKEGKGQKM